MAEKKNNEQQLYVQKEPFEYNGKMYNHYYIKGVVRGREVKIDLAPPKAIVQSHSKFKKT